MTTAVFEKVKEQSEKIKTLSESTKYTKQSYLDRIRIGQTEKYTK